MSWDRDEVDRAMANAILDEKDRREAEDENDRVVLIRNDFAGVWELRYDGAPAWNRQLDQFLSVSRADDRAAVDSLVAARGLRVVGTAWFSIEGGWASWVRPIASAGDEIS
ncbi:hypothetical protein [Curtobacterium sp. MCLR17_055]|uniref:hypothetical protein n=1 Tax=Curtobacterium sp. MCLR17_055 TaxID=2175633 RepID=UPI0011B776E3|nr:hypothetical protein [Curtobacterium sp. MCLR17_055]